MCCGLERNPVWDFAGGLVVKGLWPMQGGKGLIPLELVIKHDPACHVAWPENSVTLELLSKGHSSTV